MNILQMIKEVDYWMYKIGLVGLKTSIEQILAWQKNINMSWNSSLCPM